VCFVSLQECCCILFAWQLVGQVVAAVAFEVAASRRVTPLGHSGVLGNNI
jgi:hypothetical protein